YFNGGGPTNYTMNAPSGPMLDFLKQVEIVRGPAVVFRRRLHQLTGRNVRSAVSS
ncbi:MAG: hypothetical protein RJB37_4098, partial [Pseudomonadota bacterium]